MMLLARDKMIKIIIKIAEAELNRISAPPIKTRSRTIPQRKVVITKESGVKGLFHEIMEGIIYSIIML